MIRSLRTVGVTAALATGVVLVGPAAAAVAAPYPPVTSPAVTASAYDPCAGQNNVIGGTGYQAGETVSVVLVGSGEIGRSQVAAGGTWQITVLVPQDARGSEQLVATGLTSGLRASLTLAVTDCRGPEGGGSNGGGSLASTGAVVGGAVVAGVALLVTGGALLAVGRRRRESVTR